MSASGLLVLVVIIVYVVKHEYTCQGPGEIVDMSRQKTTRDKLDRLYDLATFDATRVKWRTPFIAACLGAIGSYGILSLKPHGSFSKMLSLIIPSFIASRLVSDFQAYHGPHRNHSRHALKMRIDLEKALHSNNRVVKSRILPPPVESHPSIV